MVAQLQLLPASIIADATRFQQSITLPRMYTETKTIVQLNGLAEVQPWASRLTCLCLELTRYCLFGVIKLYSRSQTEITVPVSRRKRGQVHLASELCLSSLRILCPWQTKSYGQINIDLSLVERYFQEKILYVFGRRMCRNGFSQSFYSSSVGTGKDRRDLQRGNGRHNHRGECGDGERRQVPCGAIHSKRRQRHATGGQPARHWAIPLR